MNKKINLVLGIALAFGATGQAHALDFWTPDDGTINDVGSFDWTVSNAIAVGGANIDELDTFQVLSHGTLGNFVDTDGNVITGTDLNVAYEITYVTSFEELVFGSNLAVNPVTNEVTGTQNFTTTGLNGNFFEIWYDPNPNSDMLAGTGFNDGTLIACGTIQAGGSGVFAANFVFSGDVTDPISVDPAAYGILDQFEDDDYVGINSVSGAGGTEFTVIVDFGFYDLTFFPNGIGPLTIDFNTSQILPFQETDPSALFAAIAGGAAPLQAGATLASVGPINGVSGPNVMFQVDANSSLQLEQIPEPASLALMGLGLAALGVGLRRRITRV